MEHIAYTGWADEESIEFWSEGLKGRDGLWTPIWRGVKY
jgi:hypothetical protein